MVPTQTRAHSPFAKTDQVLNKGRLLQIRTTVNERERERRVWIELVRIGNDVVEVFVQEGGIGLPPRL